MRLSAPFDFAHRRQLAARSRFQEAALTRAFAGLGWLVLVAAALWLYLPSLHGEFVWDDLARIGAETGVPQVGPYADVLRVDREMGTGPERYRPLTQLSLHLDALRAGGSPRAFHWTSILLHLLNVVLVCLVGRRLRLTRGAAWLAALLFAVYPLGTYAVGHIGAREEVLALTFMLLAFLLHSSRRWIWEPIAVVCFGLAVLARPAAAGVALMLVGWELQRGQSLKSSLARLVPFALVGGVMLFAVRHHFGTLGFYSAREGAPGFIARTGPLGLYRLFQLMLRPFAVTQPSMLGFRADNLVPWVRSWWEPGMLVGLVFMLGYAAATWLTLRGKGRAFLPMLALPFLWLPLDSIFFGRAFDLSRNLYAPSVAFVLMLALVVERAGFEPGAGHVRRALVGGAVAVLALSFLVAAEVRLAVWRDEGNVYLEALGRYPSVASYHAAYGTFLARRGDELPAVDELRRAVELEPDMAVAHLNLGWLEISLARYGEALTEMQRAASLMQSEPAAWYGVSEAAMRLGEFEPALAAAQRAVTLDGSRPEYHAALGAARLERGEVGEAESELRRAVDLDPRDARAHALMAALLRRTGRLDEALAAAGNAVRLDSRSPDAALEHALCLKAAGRNAEAMEELVRYESLEPHPSRLEQAVRAEVQKKITP